MKKGFLILLTVVCSLFAGCANASGDSAQLSPEPSPTLYIVEPYQEPIHLSPPKGELHIATDDEHIAQLLEYFVEEIERDTQYYVYIRYYENESDLLLEENSAVVLSENHEFFTQGHTEYYYQLFKSAYILAGPPDSQTENSISSALTNIYEQESTFVSSTSDAPTLYVEQRLWQQSGIDPYSERWYVESTENLQYASEQHAYTLCSAFDFYEQETQLVPVVTGDSSASLLYLLSPLNYEDPEYTGVLEFSNWFLSQDALIMLENYALNKYPEQVAYYAR